MFNTHSASPIPQSLDLKNMKRLILPVAVSLCILLAVSQHTVIAKDSWISVRTKNFYLIGNAGEKDVRKVGLKLEQFREVFTRLLRVSRLWVGILESKFVFGNQSC